MSRARSIAKPFPCATDALRLCGWSVEVASRVLDGPESLPDWDPSQDLTLSCSVEYRHGAFLEQTRLPANADVQLVFAAVCERTRTRFQTMVPLTAKGPSVHTLEFRVSGGALSGSLTVSVAAVLVRSLPRDRPGHATLPGSVLWSEERMLLLEDDAARFPTQWVKFEASGLASNAGWALDWDPKALDTSVFGGVRLLLNVDDARVEHAMDGESDDATARYVRAWIRADVARQLVLGALRNEEFLAHSASYEEGTVGAMVRRLIAVCFPHESDPRVLLRRLEVHPTRVEAAILAVFGVPEGGS